MYVLTYCRKALIEMINTKQATREKWWALRQRTLSTECIHVLDDPAKLLDVFKPFQ